MRAHKQAQSQFTMKLGATLAKLKDHSTVQIAHEQARALLSEHPLKQIFNGFISKMDVGEQSTERERKELCKVYVSFMEIYKEQVLADSYFEKMMESLARKSSGVSEVIGHLCKNLLSRVQDEEALLPYVNCIMNVFLHHLELPKVLRQVIDTIDPGLLASLQGQILSLLTQKVTAAKNRNDFVEAIQALVLALQERLQIDQQIMAFVLKTIKNDDWNCRKTCVDICYAMLLIRQKPHEATLSVLKELKYDKIRHVREAVNNYETLYKQVVGEELIHKVQGRQDRIRSHQPQLDKSIGGRKSPLSPRADRLKPKQKTPNKKKNQKFFKNAKDSNVILTTESAKLITQESQKSEKTIAQVTSIPEKQQSPPKQQDFQAYLRSRCDQTDQKQNPSVFKVKEPQINLSLSSSHMQPLKFSYKRELDNFRKKNRAGTEIRVEEGREVSILSEVERQFNTASLSTVSVKPNEQFEQLKQMMLQFQDKITSRLDDIQNRLQTLERTTSQRAEMVDLSTFSNRSSIAVQEQSIEVMAESILGGTIQSASDFVEGEGVESNLQDKIRTCLQMENWDEAYTIALTNNKRNILLNLLERCVFPRDKMVEECILLQIRRLLGYTGALKWLKYFLMERNMERGRLIRIRQDLLKRTSGDKNYSMMRQMLLNEIADKLGNESMA